MLLSFLSERTCDLPPKWRGCFKCKFHPGFLEGVDIQIKSNHCLLSLLQSEDWIVGYLTSCDIYSNTLHLLTRLIFNTNKIWGTISPCGNENLRHILVDIGTTLLCVNGYNGLPCRTLPVNLRHETARRSERVDNAALSSAASNEIPGQMMETTLFCTFSR